MEREICWWKTTCIVFLLCSTTAIAASAQTFNTLLNFDGTNGANPGSMTLVQGRDGNFYGTASGGGAYGNGTVFRITPQGNLTTLYSFCAQAGCPDGANPSAGLILATDGNFYGTTFNGGNPCDDWYGLGCGTVFRITPAGVLTTLYNFDSMYYGHPYAALVQASDGNFYGTTYGNLYWGGGPGSVYEITPQGAMTTLYPGDCHGGGGCAFYAGLMQANDGNLYGTSTYGGTLDGAYSGTLFKITTAGVWSTLHDFDCVYDCGDGAAPYGGLVQGRDGNFYGTTSSNSYGGTVFKITPRGKLTTLYTFCTQPNCPDGGWPNATLVQATDGNFYSTTLGLWDPPSLGTVFEITPSGVLTTLHSFNQSDGAYLYGGLLQATNGTFYGATNSGGANNLGTIFSLSMGLRPFVAFVIGSGKVGQTGGILGQSFTGVTGVSFNGTPTNFTVQGDTYLTATIPTGATTGFVAVTSPKGKLISNLPFHVLPQILSFDPPSGPAGTLVTITGVSLTQTQGVGFGNYVLANFTVISDTQVTATVPSGAATGLVGVKTVGGTAASSQIFTVTP